MNLGWRMIYENTGVIFQLLVEGERRFISFFGKDAPGSGILGQKQVNRNRQDY